VGVESRRTTDLAPAAGTCPVARRGGLSVAGSPIGTYRPSRSR
jgi:hypothetical protein